MGTVPKLGPEDFQVGLICTKPYDLAVAYSMLDEELEFPFHAARGDNNAYTYGRMGVLNVVLAVLPGAGSVPTTVAATSMCWTFTGLKMVILLGAAGAIPNDAHDMRLGDAVIALPSDGTSGIVHYSVITDKVEVIRTSANPSQSLLDCVRQFQFEIQETPIKIASWMEEGLNKFPRMRKKYQRPDNRDDRLFHADYPHTGKDCEGCDPSRLVQRAARGHESPASLWSHCNE